MFLVKFEDSVDVPAAIAARSDDLSSPSLPPKELLLQPNTALCSAVIHFTCQSNPIYPITFFGFDCCNRLGLVSCQGSSAQQAARQSYHHVTSHALVLSSGATVVSELRSQTNHNKSPPWFRFHHICSEVSGHTYTEPTSQSISSARCRLPELRPGM